jgi:hypothetical protein
MGEAFYEAHQRRGKYEGHPWNESRVRPRHRAGRNGHAPCHPDPDLC